MLKFQHRDGKCFSQLHCARCRLRPGSLSQHLMIVKTWLPRSMVMFSFSASLRPTSYDCHNIFEVYLMIVKTSLKPTSYCYNIFEAHLMIVKTWLPQSMTGFNGERKGEHKSSWGERGGATGPGRWWSQWMWDVVMKVFGKQVVSHCCFAHEAPIAPGSVDLVRSISSISRQISHQISRQISDHICHQIFQQISRKISHQKSCPAQLIWWDPSLHFHHWSTLIHYCHQMVKFEPPDLSCVFQVLIFISLHDMNNPSEVLASTQTLLSPGITLWNWELELN